MCGSVHESPGACGGWRLPILPETGVHAVVSSPVWVFRHVAQTGLELDQIS